MRPLPDYELSGLHGKARKRQYQRMVRRRLHAAGLTVRGAKPQPRRDLSWLGKVRGKARRKAILRSLTAELAKRGLTARGTPRRRLGWGAGVHECAWRALKAEMA